MFSVDSQYNSNGTDLSLHLTDATEHANVLQQVPVRQQLFPDLLIQWNLTPPQDLVHPERERENPKGCKEVRHESVCVCVRETVRE